MKFTTSVLALAVLSSVAHAQSQGPYVLTLRPTVGLTHKQRFSMNFQMGIDAKATDGKDLPPELLKSMEGASMSATANIVTKYLKISPKNIEAELSMSDFTMAGTGAMAAAADASGEIPKAFKAKLNIDPAHPDKAVFDVLDAKKSGSGSLSDMLKGSPASSFPYPDHPVSVGDYWDIKNMGTSLLSGLTGSGATGDMKDFMGVVHFVGVETVGGRTIGNFETDITGSPSIDMMGQGGMSMSINMSGLTKVDMTTGLIESGTVNGLLGMTMELPGQGKMKMNVNIVMKVETVK